MDYPIRWKQCISCQYWEAMRDYKVNDERVVLDGGNKTQGKCTHPTNNFGGLMRIGCGTCTDWQQWEPEDKDKI